MFIQTERTPNPATLKFLPGREVMPEGTLEITDPGAAAASPLAETLFGVEGVTGVFFGGDFISVTKAEHRDWADLKPEVLALVMQHFTTGAPLFREGQAPDAASAGGGTVEDDDADPQIVAQIKNLLDQKVRPAVAQDGGDIVYHGFKDGVVYLHMQGACAGCPSSTMTLKNGIENLLRYYIPEVTEVRPLA